MTTAFRIEKTADGRQLRLRKAGNSYVYEPIDSEPSSVRQRILSSLGLWVKAKGPSIIALTCVGLMVNRKKRLGKTAVWFLTTVGTVAINELFRQEDYNKKASH